jgi:hypothetical protein
MQIVVKLNVVMKIAIMLSVAMLSVVKLKAVMTIAITLSVVMIVLLC